MYRDHKTKEARRRARKHQQRTVAIAVGTKIVPDRRGKLLKRAERREE